MSDNVTNEDMPPLKRQKAFRIERPRDYECSEDDEEWEKIIMQLVNKHHELENQKRDQKSNVKT